MHPSFPCAPSPRLLRWHVRGEPPRLSTTLIIWGTAPFFNTFPHPFPHPAPPLHPPYIAKHPQSYVRKHNMLCLQQRRDATCGTPPFNLNLQVDLEAIFASLYMPFTSPPNSPTQGTCVPPPRRQVAKMGRAPDCLCARKSTPRQCGVRPQIPIDMQASDVLAMCQRVRRQIDLGQLRTIDMRVDLRGRYIGMSQDLL